MSETFFQRAKIIEDVGFTPVLNYTYEKFSDALISKLYELNGIRAIQMNSLDGGTPEDWIGFSNVYDSGFGIRGFQTVCPSSNTGRFDGTLEQALDKIDEADYIELYRGDLGYGADHETKLMSQLIL